MKVKTAIKMLIIICLCKSFFHTMHYYNMSHETVYDSVPNKYYLLEVIALTKLVKP